MGKFDNKRFIIRCHFKDLMELNLIKKGNMRNLLDKINSINKGLKSCRISTDGMSQFMAYFVSTKLDNNIRSNFKNNITDNSNYPTLEVFQKCLHGRSFTAEGCAIDQSNLKVLRSDIKPVFSQVK